LPIHTDLNKVSIVNVSAIYSRYLTLDLTFHLQNILLVTRDIENISIISEVYRTLHLVLDKKLCYIKQITCQRQCSSATKPYEKVHLKMLVIREFRGGFRHVQRVRPNRGPTKNEPHKRTWAENNRVITKYSVNVG